MVLSWPTRLTTLCLCAFTFSAFTCNIAHARTQVATSELADVTESATPSAASAESQGHQADGDDEEGRKGNGERLSEKNEDQHTGQAKSAKSATIRLAESDAIFQEITALSKEKRQKLRIIALAPHIVESMFEVGAGHQIIATTAHADYPEAAKDILQIGNYARLQIEKIVQLQPDVVIAWKTGNPGDDLSRLKKYQVKVIYSNPTTLSQVADELLMLGQLTGRETAAEQAATAYTTQLNSLKTRYAQQAPIRTFYELWSRPLRTVANNAWPQQQLALCGAQNPFAHANDDYPSVGLEQVLATLPQVIIQPTQHAADTPDALNWAKWQHIPAAQNGFIFHPNADKVHRMTSRMLDEVALMCEQIDKARQFYQVDTPVSE
ncbi:cobalamin-binding protein [Paraglaciecola chathamensis]|jgi:vitamin B12 transport system substrate-binding protein|uniref:Vitamin B12 transport system substrate-binding protein n=1 Tax=Paraglaciecola agarilytica NO2 TaxID=1125747 RepID=A0ABQ0IDM4_9ALTE|nr:cobalamin-binding protein [Paraglaciecola agarilytica]GAC07425.1 vitamin B12 transport system substrate-binding protein [Paraglaciecola agarilytica NO2]